MPTAHPTPRHGTTARYRRGCKCERCRSANAKAKSRQRARAKQRGATPILSLVGDVQIGTTPEPVAPVADSRPEKRHVPAYGAMEKSVSDDLASYDHDRPFFNTLKAAALALAREIDDIDSRTSKAPLVKQLVDVVREIKGKDADDGQSLDQFLFGDIGNPVVVAAPKGRNKA